MLMVSFKKLVMGKIRFMKSMEVFTYCNVTNALRSSKMIFSLK